MSADRDRGGERYFPHPSDELEWKGRAPLDANAIDDFRYLCKLARRALASLPPGHEDVRVRLDHVARVAASRELPPELAGVRLSVQEWANAPFASEALRKLAARWPVAHGTLYASILERERVPGYAESERLRALATAGQHDAALALLADVRKRDVDAYVTCAAQAEGLGDLAHGRAYLVHALEGAEIFASWATSGGEGFARMAAVERLRAKVGGK